MNFNISFNIGKDSLQELLELTELPPSDSLQLTDKREAAKLKFPFYMMDIRHFEAVLEKTCAVDDKIYLNNDDMKT